MKLLILSDSHGNLNNMIRAVDLVSPRMVVHLGDCWQDGQRLRAAFPDLDFVQVPGNCDFRPEGPLERTLDLGGKRILLCHGHTYHVKESLLSASLAAEEKRADLFLFGHTHRPLESWRGGTLLLNPGSIGDYFRPSYAVVTLQNGELKTALHLLKT